MVLFLTIKPQSMNNIYSAFICSGKPKTDSYRESGSYTAIGKNYAEAATNFAAHYNICIPFNIYGTQWKSAGREKGNPKQHRYLIDEKGNKLLLIAKGEKTIFDPTK
jgi:hypothetical protein